MTATVARGPTPAVDDRQVLWTGGRAGPCGRPGTAVTLDGGLAGLWWAIGGYPAARLVTLVWRIRGTAWLRTGAVARSRR